MYVSVNDSQVIETVSKRHMKVQGKKTLFCPGLIDMNEQDLIGKRLSTEPARDLGKCRIALICNWADKCGIATYTEQLIRSLKKCVGEIRIFAEHCEAPEETNVVRCWKRGESMVDCIRQVQEWKPDLIFVQHEFGIFPKATHFMKMLELLDKTPYVITTHSVYEHLDKTVCLAYIKNIIVHTKEGRDCLRTLGHTNEVSVIPHGCLAHDDVSELWNIFQNEHTVIQFGFGFDYKGVDKAVEAIRHLKETNPDFKDIFYCYLCSESNFTRRIQEGYYDKIRQIVQQYGLEENVTVLRGYLSEQYIRNFLRTAKLAIFPYVNNPNNMVYGASGAIKNAMANGIPVIASQSHLFDDLEGVVPRPDTAVELAGEIEKVFSDWEYRNSLREQSLRYVRENSWDVTAQRHLDVFRRVIDASERDIIRVESAQSI